MRTSVQVFATPKWGNSAAEYEDAHWPRQTGDASGVVHLAVADGATETSFSGMWARLLVKSYGRGRLAEANWDEELNRIRRVWQRAVGQKPLPWYAEEKLRLGAFSSLAGLTLIPSTESEGQAGEFAALAIGDSCLFQVRDGKMIWSFPFATSEEFNSRPWLLSSLSPGAEREIAAQGAHGVWQPGDLFFLMTDALACWTMRRLEAGDDPFATLLAIDMVAAFEAFVTEQRAAVNGEGVSLLTNDDVTMVMY
jgi:hypothetical protein